MTAFCYTVADTCRDRNNRLRHLATEYRWELYVRFTNIPTPGEVVTEAARLSGDPRFFTNITTSLRRILVGFAFATIFGVLLGLLIGRYALLRGLLFPAMEVIRPIPAIAWVPMAGPTFSAATFTIVMVGLATLLVLSIVGIANALGSKMTPLFLVGKWGERLFVRLFPEPVVESKA